jgi:hypothetical protein
MPPGLDDGTFSETVGEGFVGTVVNGVFVGVFDVIATLPEDADGVWPSVGVGGSVGRSVGRGSEAVGMLLALVG